MKLIDAPIGIFRFDGELVLKTEYCSENKLSGKYIPDCYIVRTGEYFWGGAKTANELNNLDVEPIDFAELLPIVTDTISRQAAIEALAEHEKSNGHNYTLFVDIVSECAEIIRNLPPAQPEQLGTNLAEVGTDLISRQAAIDAVHRSEALDRAFGYGHAVDALRELPPAQPEPYTDVLKAEIKRMKRSFTICVNSDYYTGYMSALSAVEGYIAHMEVTT